MTTPRLLHPLRVAAAGAVAVIGVRMRRVMVVVIMVVIMVVVMIAMMMTVMDIICIRADSLDVVMVAGLRQADLGIESEDHHAGIS